MHLWLWYSENHERQKYFCNVTELHGKSQYEKIVPKQQPLLSRVDMGWEPRRIGGGGGWEGYRSQERRKEKEEAKELKGRSWESKVWEARG